MPALTRCFRRLALSLSVVLVGCMQPRTPESEFARLYAQWLRESEGIRFSSRTEDYTGLPAFRSIVRLGPSAVPVIQRHLEGTDCQTDFFLAHALVEIHGWKRSEVRHSGLGEQEFCRAVLSRTTGAATPDISFERTTGDDFERRTTWDC